MKMGANNVMLRGVGLMAVALLAVGAERGPLEPPELGAAPEPVLVDGPRIQFANSVFDFGRIVNGTVVKHQFAFTNTGTQTLEISQVQASCGCTTAGEWSRRVEPGKTGTIPVEFHSANFNGTVSKVLSVASNDRTQPSVVLQVKGTIWKPIELNPQFAMLNVIPDSGSNAVALITIKSNMEQPVTLQAPQCNNPAFAVQLTTNQPGREFVLRVESVGVTNLGNTFGKVTMRTSVPEAPILEVTLYAAVQAAVTVSPSQLVLPTGPLTARQTQYVNVRGMWKQPLAVSEPAINVPGVDLQLSEVQPGRYFRVAMTFPEGFQWSATNKMELTLKSNHPQYPLLRVPVVQMVRSTSAGTPPAVR